MQAISPKGEIPALPHGAKGWRRSKRRGSMYHAHDYLGAAMCGRITFDRNNSESADNLGDMQFWGICPHCHRLATKDKPNAKA